MLRLLARYWENAGCLPARWGRSRGRAPLLTRARQRWWGDDRGSELIEVAIVLPVYFMLVFGLTSYAIALFAYCNATFAAEAAVRYAVVHSTATMYPSSPTSIQNVVMPYMWGAPSGGVTVNSTWNAANSVGSIVYVTVTVTYSTGLPYAHLTGLVESASAQGYIVH